MPVYFIPAYITYIMAFGADQSNELSVLDGDDGRVSPDSLLKMFGRIDCTIRVFRSFDAWVMHSLHLNSMGSL